MLLRQLLVEQWNQPERGWWACPISPSPPPPFTLLWASLSWDRGSRRPEKGGGALLVSSQLKCSSRVSHNHDPSMTPLCHVQMDHPSLQRKRPYQCIGAGVQCLGWQRWPKGEKIKGPLHLKWLPTLGASGMLQLLCTMIRRFLKDWQSMKREHPCATQAQWAFKFFNSVLDLEWFCFDLDLSFQLVLDPTCTRNFSRVEALSPSLVCVFPTCECKQLLEKKTVTVQQMLSYWMDVKLFHTYPP